MDSIWIDVHRKFHPREVDFPAQPRLGKVWVAGWEPREWRVKKFVMNSRDNSVFFLKETKSPWKNLPMTSQHRISMRKEMARLSNWSLFWGKCVTRIVGAKITQSNGKRIPRPLSYVFCLSCEWLYWQYKNLFICSRIN